MYFMTVRVERGLSAVLNRENILYIIWDPEAEFWVSHSELQFGAFIVKFAGNTDVVCADHPWTGQTRENALLTPEQREAEAKAARQKELARIRDAARPTDALATEDQVVPVQSDFRPSTVSWRDA